MRKLLKELDTKYLFGSLIYFINNFRKIPWIIKNRNEVYLYLTNKVSFKRFEKIDLLEHIASKNKKYMNNAAPTSIKQLKNVFNKLMDIDYSLLEDPFIDIGCGEGKVLILASKFGFKKIIGVEFAKNLVDACEKNLLAAKVKNVSVYLEDAANYEIPSDSRVFYLYNPFHVVMLEKVTKNIEKSFINSHRDGYIVFIDPRNVTNFSLGGKSDSNSSKHLVNKPNQYDESNPIWSLLNKKYELIIQYNSVGQPFHIYKINHKIITSSGTS